MSKAEVKKEEMGTLTIWEYATDSNNLSIARGIVNGRFPEEGKFMNTECEEMYFVMNGTGTLYVEDETIELKQHDAYLIKPNKAYYVEGNNLELLLPTSPKWTMEQGKIIK